MCSFGAEAIVEPGSQERKLKQQTSPLPAPAENLQLLKSKPSQSEARVCWIRDFQVSSLETQDWIDTQKLILVLLYPNKNKNFLAIFEKKISASSLWKSSLHYIFSLFLNTSHMELGCNSLVRCLPSLCKVLCSICNITRGKKSFHIAKCGLWTHLMKQLLLIFRPDWSFN